LKTPAPLAPAFSYSLVSEALMYLKIYGIVFSMKVSPKQPSINEALITISEFVVAYNKTIPAEWPKANKELMQKFREANPSIFRHGELWSIDLHRKKIIDWLPLNSKVS
jgi:hypothetical protein